MAIFDQFPWTDVHQLNLNWLIKTVKQIQEEWDSFGYSVTAQAISGLYPNVEVTGDLRNGLDFKFTLVKGDKGDTGPQGADGVGISQIQLTPGGYLIITYTDGTNWFSGFSLKGQPGAGLVILDVFATLTDLQTAHPTGISGDAYLVGTTDPYTVYFWSRDNSAWVSGGTITTPTPSNTLPVMDGVADWGSESSFARGDHVHPTDTSRAAAADLRLKQDALVSGTNIKSINSESLLGAGDIALPTLQDIYPVGSLYFNRSNGANPASLFGFGTWVQIRDTFLLAAGLDHANGETGGSETVTLTAENLPPQTGAIQIHGGGGSQPGTIVSNVNGVFTTSASISGAYRQGSRYTGANSVGDIIYNNGGASDPVDNMPPYLAVYVWMRTA